MIECNDESCKNYDGKGGCNFSFISLNIAGKCTSYEPKEEHPKTHPIPTNIVEVKK